MDPVVSGPPELEGLLTRQSSFLSPHKDALVKRWSELYLVQFGRDAFFSGSRVRKVFSELTGLYLECLYSHDLGRYFDALTERGALFARLAVPFDELMLCLHLFEEACLELLLNSYPRPQELPAAVMAFEDLHNRGLVCLASSYFESVRSELSRTSAGLKDENDQLRLELEQARHSVFSLASNDLSAMQLAISSVNAKLKNRVYSLSRVQRLTEALSNETSLPKLFKNASIQIRALLPEGSDVWFGLTDAERRWVELYQDIGREEHEAVRIRKFYFSELPAAIQETLCVQERRAGVLKGPDSCPAFLREWTRVRNQSELLVLPMRKYGELLGLVLCACPASGFFGRGNTKMLTRAAQALGAAVSSAQFYGQRERFTRFERVQERLAGRDLRALPLEESLNFCLESLMEITGAERSSLMLLDGDSGELSVRAAKGLHVYPIGGLKLRMGEGIAGMALKERKPIAVSRMLAPRPRRGDRSVALKSLLCLPLLKGAQPVGIINLSTLNFHKQFEPSEVDKAQEFAGILSGLLPGPAL